MGASSSKTQSSVDIANTVVTNVVTNVLTKNKLSVSGNQSIEIGCDEKAFALMTSACSKDTENMMKWLSIDNTLSGAEKQAIIEKGPKSCDSCTFDGNVSQEMILSISAQDTQDNSIANAIKSQLSAKVNDELKNNISGTIGAASSKVTALTNIKNYVDNKFETNIVNETLKQFAFSQNVKITNQKSTGVVTQKLVANVMASNIVNNAISSDASLKSDIEKATKAEATTTGAIDSIMSMVKLLGGLWIVGAFIAFIVGAFLVVKFKLYCMFPPLASMCVMNSAMGVGDDGDDGDEEE